MAWLIFVGYIMLCKKSSRSIPISQVEVSNDITPPVLRILMPYPAMLRDANQLTPEALELAAMQAPMVVYEKKDKSDPIRYCCIGNLRTFFLLKMLGKNIATQAMIIKRPEKKDIDTISLKLTLLEKSCFLLEPSQTRDFLISHFELLSSRGGKEALKGISPYFNNRTSFLESFGLNRRV